MQVFPNWLRGGQMRLTKLLAPLLILFTFAIFVVIVQVQHQIRHTQTMYAESLKEQVSLQEHWRKLTLEKHHLTALARVENLAKKKLEMAFKSEQNFQTIFLEKKTQEVTQPSVFTPPIPSPKRLEPRGGQ